MNNKITAIILAAGFGTRMKSHLPKVLHKIAGRALIDYVIDAAKICSDNIVIVTGYEHLQVENHVKLMHVDIDIDFARQSEQLGTAHAVKTALESVTNTSDYYLILYGDTPLITQENIAQLHQKMITDQNNITLIAFHDHSDNRYGRLIINEQQGFVGITEYIDLKEDQKNITLCNSGIMMVKNTAISFINQIKNDNNKGEYYLTDIIKYSFEAGLKLDYVIMDSKYAMGVNDKMELAYAENLMQEKLRIQAMSNGVTMIDPNSVYLSADIIFGQDVVLHPNVYFGGQISIGDNTQIFPGSFIESDVVIGRNCKIGPNAKIRTGTILDDDIIVGNLAEVKNSHLKSGVKANHFCYIGDAIIGENVNIGAGTVTCNYDGRNKHKTIIADNNFIGANSTIIAPRVIEKNSFIAAGSVINKDVPENHLAIARNMQVNKMRKE